MRGISSGMADETGLTQNAIVRIWHAFGMQPHREFPVSMRDSDFR